MKKLVIGLVFLASGAAGAAEFSGNVAYTTDYRFRGISQGDRSQAIQGGFDIDLGSGFYFGTWASNVAAWSAGTIEVDYYAGFSTDLSDSLAADVGVIYYNYPEDDADPDLDYVEIYGSLSFQDLTVGAAFSNDYFAATDTFWYLYGDYSLGLTEAISLDLHLGMNLFDGKDAGGAFGIGDPVDPNSSYLDYSVGLGASAVGLDWGISLVGTDLDKGECFGGSRLCDTTLVLSVSRSL